MSGEADPAADDAADHAADDAAANDAAVDGGTVSAAGATDGSDADDRADTVSTDGRSPTGAGGAGPDGEEPGFETGTSSVGVGLAVLASLAAVLPLVTTPPGLALGLVGFALLGVGVRAERPRLFGFGVAGLAGGVVLGGLAGAAPSAVLAATAGTLLAWDVGDNALVVGEQLGRAAPTARLELVHATASGIVLATGAAGVYAVFSLVGGGRPTLALALLLLGATLLAATLR